MATTTSARSLVYRHFSDTQSGKLPAGTDTGMNANANLNSTSPYVRALGVLVLLWLLPGATECEETGDELDGLRELEGKEVAAPWWDRQWKWRRAVQIEDPSLAVAKSEVVFLKEPAHLLLLLANTGRCQHELADVRLVDAGGRLLAGGVLNFGRDDGSALLWLTPKFPKGAGQTAYRLFLYYGNPAAPPLPAPAAPSAVPGAGNQPVATVAEEESATGAAAPATRVGQFFEGIRVLESRDFRDPNGKALAESAGTVRPETFTAKLSLPEAGLWHVHVRFAAATEPRPFILKLAGQERACGAQNAKDCRFLWDSFGAQLPAGECVAELPPGSRSAPDRVLFTRDADYRPDSADISGPV
ncbi:MAG: hypothetical protein ABSE73_10670, partial [Planctomycetota bacterium]